MPSAKTIPQPIDIIFDLHLDTGDVDPHLRQAVSFQVLQEAPKLPFYKFLAELHDSTPPEQHKFWKAVNFHMIDMGRHKERPPATTPPVGFYKALTDFSSTLGGNDSFGDVTICGKVTAESVQNEMGFLKNLFAENLVISLSSAFWKDDLKKTIGILNRHGCKAQVQIDLRSNGGDHHVSVNGQSYDLSEIVERLSICAKEITAGLNVHFCAINNAGTTGPDFSLLGKIDALSKKIGADNVIYSGGIGVDKKQVASILAQFPNINRIGINNAILREPIRNTINLLRDFMNTLKPAIGD